MTPSAIFVVASPMILGLTMENSVLAAENTKTTINLNFCGARYPESLFTDPLKSFGFS